MKITMNLDKELNNMEDVNMNRYEEIMRATMIMCETGDETEMEKLNLSQKAIECADN